MGATPGNRSELDQFILAAATAVRELGGADLQRVLEHVAQAGFDPYSMEKVGGRVAGLLWQGRVLTGNDRLPPAEVHYLRHVVVAREWPLGTSLPEYLRSARDVIRDGRSGVLTSRYQGAWQLTVVRRAEELQGPDGFGWVLVDYRVQTGHWVTVFQPADGLRVLQRPTREDFRWLRQPQ